MGMFSFLRTRRERESALPPSANVSEPSRELGSFASPEGQPVVGQQVDGGLSTLPAMSGTAAGLESLAQIGPMIQKAIETGNVQIEQGTPQTIDLRGTGLREQILGIMRQHGIDPQAATAGEPIDAGAHGAMQQQILEALRQHGVDVGTGFGIQPGPEE